MFELATADLQRLLVLNQFALPEASADRTLVFFGVRGCLPADAGDQGWKERVALGVQAVDHETPRCTLLQWDRGADLVAAFPGSTVPHRRYVARALAAGGQGANELMAGYYEDYRRGVHRAGTPTAHEAFRQTDARPIRRTSDDLDYDPLDRVDLENPCDNLHAAWSMGVTHAYESAGCQVVVGYPRCPQRGAASDDAGPWRTFKANAYAGRQVSFPYVLLEGATVARAIEGGAGPASPRLRYGSSGALVDAVQAALARAGMYEGERDGRFGPRTLRAVLAFQRARFGADAGDGIVGPMTAEALGVPWPAVGDARRPAGAGIRSGRRVVPAPARPAGGRSVRARRAGVIAARGGRQGAGK